MEQKNYYDILGVKESATAEEIRKAFRHLAKECHPDHHPGDAKAEARFKSLSEAYEVLGNAEQRKKYDELRRYSTGGGAPGMSFEEFSQRYGGRAQTSEGDFFGFGRVDLNDLFSRLFSGGGSRFRGTATSGNPWEGMAQEEAESSEPRPTSDAFFRHIGLDAYVDITMNPAQAMLGTTLRLRSPSGGKVQIRLPEGTQPETRKRIRGQGFSAQGGKGDLYVTIHVSMPESLTEEEKELVRKLAESRGWKY